jgi:DNA-binding response OmpR family regulator
MFHPDVVILDIGLPGLDGFTLARKLRKTDSRLQIMAMTGYGQEPDRRQAGESGIQNYMIKPVDPAALQKLLAATPSN